MASSDVISVLFSGGVAAAITVLVNAYRLWKDAKQKQEETILGRWKEELKRSGEKLRHEEYESEYQERLADYYKARTADLEFYLRQQGIALPPVSPPPVRSRKHGVPSTTGELPSEGNTGRHDRAG